MESKSSPNIAGVPEEVQKIIISDLQKAAAPEVPAISHCVGISVSENEDLGILGYSSVHLRDLTIEIVRHLLINDAKIVYGGDLRKEGYTELFSDLAYQYRSIADAKKILFQNYFAYPIYCLLSRQNELEFKKSRTDIVKVLPPEDLNIEQDKYIAPNTLEAKFIWCRSLSKMRNIMIENTDARILIGGKCSNYLGKMPGVIEEAKITVANNKPLYLIGAFGGASKEVINAVQGKGFTYIANNFHSSPEYEQFKLFYNEREMVDKINVEGDAILFERMGTEGLSKNNGLTVEENERLFHTPHLSEILFYIFKGLNNL